MAEQPLTQRGLQRLFDSLEKMYVTKKAETYVLVAEEIECGRW